MDFRLTNLRLLNYKLKIREIRSKKKKMAQILNPKKRKAEKSERDPVVHPEKDSTLAATPDGTTEATPVAHKRRKSSRCT